MRLRLVSERTSVSIRTVIKPRSAAHSAQGDEQHSLLFILSAVSASLLLRCSLSLSSSHPFCFPLLFSVIIVSSQSQCFTLVSRVSFFPHFLPPFSFCLLFLLFLFSLLYFISFPFHSLCSCSFSTPFFPLSLPSFHVFFLHVLFYFFFLHFFPFVIIFHYFISTPLFSMFHFPSPFPLPYFLSFFLFADVPSFPFQALFFFRFLSLSFGSFILTYFHSFLTFLFFLQPLYVVYEFIFRFIQTCSFLSFLLSVLQFSFVPFCFLVALYISNAYFFTSFTSILSCFLTSSYCVAFLSFFPPT